MTYSTIRSFLFFIVIKDKPVVTSVVPIEMKLYRIRNIAPNAMAAVSVSQSVEIAKASRNAQNARLRTVKIHKITYKNFFISLL